MRTVSLAQLKADVISQADLVEVSSDTFITTTELNRWIVQSTRTFFGMFLLDSSARYFESEHQFHSEDGTGQYNLPSDFFQAYQVDVIRDGVMFPIYPATPEELAWGQFTALPSDEGCQNSYEYPDGRPRYRLIGNKIELIPVPTKIYCVKIRYVPTTIAYASGGGSQVDLSADTDYIDGINGFEQWIVYDVCIKAKMKQEEDISELMVMKRGMEKAIKRQVKKRDRGPKFIRCTEPEDRVNYGHPFFRGW